MGIDRSIQVFLREHNTLAQNTVLVLGIVAGFVVICGSIRFGIAIYRRRKGIYPPAASQMEEY